MKAVGIDTRVVLRLLVGEPEDQAARAKSFVETCYYDGIAVCVSDMVVAESYHALIYHIAGCRSATPPQLNAYAKSIKTKA